MIKKLLNTKKKKPCDCNSWKINTTSTTQAEPSTISVYFVEGKFFLENSFWHIDICIFENIGVIRYMIPK